MARSEPNPAKPAERPAKASKAKPPAVDTPAPPEARSAAPAGYERVHPREVAPKVTKAGRFFWACKLEFADRSTLTANTWSKHIAERLLASVGQPTDVALTQKEKDGTVYYNIAEVI